MIKLCVEDYCQNCPDFRAHVEQVLCTNNTNIYCKNRDRCWALVEYLSKEVKEK